MKQKFNGDLIMDLAYGLMNNKRTANQFDVIAYWGMVQHNALLQCGAVTTLVRCNQKQEAPGESWKCMDAYSAKAPRHQYPLWRLKISILLDWFHTEILHLQGIHFEENTQ